MPGEWHEHDGDFDLCESEFCLTNDPGYWSFYTNAPCFMYECELGTDANLLECDSLGLQIAVSKFRLTKLFTGCIYNVGVTKEQHYVNGLLHKDDDEPAIIYSNGTIGWYQNGKLHRGGDKPARIHNDGTIVWYKHGLTHRDNDLPAAIHSNGTMIWFYNDNIHRGGNLPAVIHSNGAQDFWVNGRRVYNT